MRTPEMFRALAVRNYRLFASGQLVSLTGTWMQRTAQDWLVLEISGNSGVALGIVTALQFLPVLLFGLYGGVLADRFDKRRLLIGAQAAMGVLALVLGLLVVTGSVQLWHVYVLAALLGLAAVVDTPVRQAFVSEMVGPDVLTNAVSLNSTTFNAGRVIGPAVAGLMIAGIGTGAVFLVNAASYLGVIVGLLAMRVDELTRSAPVARAKGQLLEGVAYARARPEIWLPIVLVFFVGTFGLNFQITLALMAKEVFGRGPGAFGLLGTMFAVGALLGSLLSARRREVRQRLLIGSAIAFGLMEVVVGLMPTYLTFAILLVPTGMLVLTFTTAANTAVQLAAAPHMRGRVMALYVMVFLGGTPVGAPLIGLLAEHAGPRWSLLVGGLVTAIAAVVIGLLLGRAGHVRPVPFLRPRPGIRMVPIDAPPGAGPLAQPAPLVGHQA